MKPNGPMMIDPNHKLGPYCKYFYDYGKLQDLVTGNRATLVDAGADFWTRQPGPKGSAATSTDTVSNPPYIQHSHPVNLSGSDFTYVSTFDFDYNICTQTEHFDWDYLVAGWTHRLYTSGSELYGLFSGYYSGGSTGMGIITSLGTLDKQRRTVVLSVTGDFDARVAVWTESGGLSVKEATLSNAIPHNPTNDARLFFVWAYGAAGNMYSSGHFTRGSTLAECASLAKDPYQILKPLGSL
jgi:hypothetical protein